MTTARVTADEPSVLNTIWTIGHSSRSWEEFLALLRAHRIEAIADVRRFAGSRRFPQFGRDQLPGRLRAAGIDYIAIDELGGRRRPVPDSPNTVWRNPSFRAYADHMASAEYATGRAQLLSLAQRLRTAILCSEAVWWRCHRSLIADDLKAAGIEVLHIMGEGRATEHPYTSAASVREGRLVYGAKQGGGA
jgi:uncharacterized protein (DUF488 family)